MNDIQILDFDLEQLRARLRRMSDGELASVPLAPKAA